MVGGCTIVYEYEAGKAQRLRSPVCDMTSITTATGAKGAGLSRIQSSAPVILSGRRSATTHGGLLEQNVAQS